MDYDSFLELIKNTRSIRRFKPDPVPQEEIEKIVEAGRLAPSGFNQQPWEFVVVRKPELRKRINDFISTYKLHSKEMESTREAAPKASAPEPEGPATDYSVAPVYILVLGDKRCQKGLPLPVQFDKTRLDIIFTSSLSNAFTYMHMAAGTLGLASQWVSSVQDPYVSCMIKDLLGIREELGIYDMLAVGYSAVRARPKLLREPFSMVHYDDCGTEDFRTDEEVRDFINKARTWTIASHNRKADN